jgi:hypothetical protein
LGERVSCVVGDFCALPDALGQTDAAYTIEAFAHGAGARPFFAEAARLVVPGGLLAVCDDFLRETNDPAAAITVDQFRRGWRLNALVTVSEVPAAAARAGFVHERTTELTPWLKLDRPRERSLALLSLLLGQVPWLPQRTGRFLGGSALRHGLRRGWIGYDLLLFRRTG